MQRRPDPEERGRERRAGRLAITVLAALPAFAVGLVDPAVAGAATADQPASAFRVVDGKCEVVQTTVGGDAALGSFARKVDDTGRVLALERDVDYLPAADPLRGLQWGLDAVGFEHVHPTGDGSGVTVAVLDAGIAAGHPELSGQLVDGWDAVEDRPWSPLDADRQIGDGNHGTHVAGIIGALSNNGIGVHGAAPGVDLVPVRVIHSSGGTSGDVAEGICWAANQGVDVINLSLSSVTESEVVKAAVAFAALRDIVMVAAAGNLGEEGSPTVWPAAHPETIAVSATDAGGTVWSRSNRGDYVDVAAPGVGIVSLGGNPGAYWNMTGTSQAGPHVAALAAIIRGVRPDMTAEQVRAAITGGARDVGPVGLDPAYGYGIVDAVESVGLVEPPAPPSSLGVVDLGAEGLRLEWAHGAQWRERAGYEVLVDGQLHVALGRGAVRIEVPRPAPGAAPRYQVRTVGANGVRSAPAGLATAPAEVRAAPGPGALTITWPPVSAAAQPVSGYVVVRDGAVIGSIAPHADPAAWLSFVDTTGEPGQQYGYQVGAVLSSGLGGDLSTPLHAAPGHLPPLAEGVVSAQGGAGWVELAWPAATGVVSGYRIERDGAVLADAGLTLSYADHTAPPGVHSYLVVAVGPGGEAAYPPVEVSVVEPVTGYWIVTDAGRAIGFGGAASAGEPPSTGDVVAGSVTPSGRGYWLARANGVVEAFGDAAWHGDARALPLVAPVVAMATTPDGAGYWLLAADGGVFTYGTAGFFGSTGGMVLAAPVLDLAVTPSGEGYWFVAADGGVFTFGDAPFLGSMGGQPLDAPVVSMAAGPHGGYWLIAADGGVFSFGEPFYGSLPGTLAAVPLEDRPTVVRMRPVEGGAGYLLLADDGGIFGYGRYAFQGSAAGALAADEAVVDLMVGPLTG